MSYDMILLFCVQVLLNMLEFGMNPQQALDAPRVYVQYDHTSKYTYASH